MLDFNINNEDNIIEELDELSSRSKYYTLSFSFTFQNENDQVYIAHHFPYGYSKLLAELDFLEKKATQLKTTPYFQVQTLCYAVGCMLFFIDHSH